MIFYQVWCKCFVNGVTYTNRLNNTIYTRWEDAEIRRNENPTHFIVSLEIDDKDVISALGIIESPEPEKTAQFLCAATSYDSKSTNYTYLFDSLDGTKHIFECISKIKNQYISGNIYKFNLTDV